MYKKFVGLLAVSIFIVGTLSTAAPAFAHFTLGLQCGSIATPSCPVPVGGRFRLNDFERDPAQADTHRPGVLGWVFPGAGFASWLGNPASLGGALVAPPSYQSPNPGSRPSGSPPSWFQLDGNAYTPAGAILSSTADRTNRGDLIFAINFTYDDRLHPPPRSFIVGPHRDFIYQGVTIYIPPEFDLRPHFRIPPDGAGYIASTLTNSHVAVELDEETSRDIFLTEAETSDPWGAGWTVLTIRGNIWFTEAHGWTEWYYIRINNVGAPKIAGRYFFKMFMWNSTGLQFSYDQSSFSNLGIQAVRAKPFGTNLATAFQDPGTLVMPVENWPVLLVKGEIDPAIVTGTIRYGTFNQDLYQRPIQLPGRVRAVGVATDPYTGRSTGRAVEARGYFNASAAGHYEVEGVAPGVYDIYASAAGYPELKIATGVKILAGQSYLIDGFLQPGSVIEGTIFSKHLFAEEPWPSAPRPVYVEIYKSREGARNVNPADVVAFSPYNMTHPPYMAYNWHWTQGSPSPRLVAFPWEGPATTPSGSTSIQPPNHAFTTAGMPAGQGKAVFGLHNGVGRDQFWWVTRVTGDPAIAGRNGPFTLGALTGNPVLTPTTFRFFFGEKSFYGAPTEFTGHIPQVMASWVNGLTAGTYYMRAWINGYVQKEVDGIKDFEAGFTVTPQEFPGDIRVPIDLRVSSVINKTVWFHDLPGTLQPAILRKPVSDRDLAAGTDDHNEIPVDGSGTRVLMAEVFDTRNRLVAFNFTLVRDAQDHVNILINGFGMAGPDTKFWETIQGLGAFRGQANTGGLKFSLLPYRGIRDYGIPSGTYTVRVYMRGYIQQEFEQVSVVLSGSQARISNHMYRGGLLNVTVFSVDFQRPRIDRNWVWQGAPLRAYIINEKGIMMGYMDNPHERGEDATQPTGTGIFRWINWDGHVLSDHDGAESSKQRELLPIWKVSGILREEHHYRADDLSTLLALDTGTYTLFGSTYGYVQKQTPTLFVQKGGKADMRLQLTIGANITLNIFFKKENIFDHAPFNASLRVRVFDDKQRLVGHVSLGAINLSEEQEEEHGGGLAAFPKPRGMYSEPREGASFERSNILATAGDSIIWFHNGAWRVWDDPGHGGVGSEYGAWVPGSTTQLRVLIAGIFDRYDPWISPKNFLPPARYFYGIDGAPNYLGDYTVEVDYVPWYFKGALQLGLKTAGRFGSPDNPSVQYPDGNSYYPPVPGLLTGESHHTVPGSPAGIFGITSALSNGLSVANHLGPLGQRQVWRVTNAHLSGESSAVYELDLRGFIQGQILAFTFNGEFRPASYVTVVASGAGGFGETVYSWDSNYEAYLPPGAYRLSIVEWTSGGQGHSVIDGSVTVSSGQFVRGTNWFLEQSKIPIPEFPTLAILVFSALAASLQIARRARRKLGN